MADAFCRRCNALRPTYPDVVSGQKAERCLRCHYPVSYGASIGGYRIDGLLYRDEHTENIPLRPRGRPRKVVEQEEVVAPPVLSEAAGRRLFL
jgi:hypothetical protein